MGRSPSSGRRHSAPLRGRRKIGQVHISSTRGILAVFRSCVPRKRSPTQIARRATKPPAGPGIVWVPYGHGRTRRSAGRSVCGVPADAVDPRFLARPLGCWRCGGTSPGVVAALDPLRPLPGTTCRRRAIGGEATRVGRHLAVWNIDGIGTGPSTSPFAHPVRPETCGPEGA